MSLSPETVIDRTEEQPSPAEGASPARSSTKGLSIEPVFCPSEVDDLFITVDWDSRTATIKDESGQILFEQRDCEVPAEWSQLALNVVASKYFYGEPGTAERERSVRQLIHRVTRTITDWGVADGYFASPDDGERFYRELSWLCLHQHGAFNSPVWFNVGLHAQYGITGRQSNWRWDEPSQAAVKLDDSYAYPQTSACFIQSVADTMESIMELATSEALLFKYGSGTGTNLSALRSAREKLSGGGKPSGPLSFMRIYDQVAGTVKSGGKTRRAAKMQILDVGHPDILEFIECKSREESKARALIAAGYDANFNGEAYGSVFFQNANLSVMVSDDFMRSVTRDENWHTHWITEPGREGPRYRARDLLARMSESAWQCGDPGIQYAGTINRWHTCPNSGPIRASNPCSEYLFLDDSACNLASLNLMKFRRADGTFDHARFGAACRIFFIAQEILIDRASYPTAKIAENSHRFRPLGLGYSNLGSLLMAAGVPYDSAAARGWCGALTALLHGFANLTSAELAASRGAFEGFAKNREPMLAVMKRHAEAIEDIDPAAPDELVYAARNLWTKVLAEGRRHGFRNAQATVLAPTGTISFMLDCDTTGIEPDIALVKYKQLAGGGMLKIVNRTVPLSLRTLGYDEPNVEAITGYLANHDRIDNAPALRPEHVAVFDCAFPPPNGDRVIAWHGHVGMMAAAQPFISGAISKTVNLPQNSTPADIAEVYLLGWKLGLKALAVYRDGSKGSQPLNTKSDTDSSKARASDSPTEVELNTSPANHPIGKSSTMEVHNQVRPARERLPDTRRSLTHKFSVGGHEGYITVGLYEDGRPGELFIIMAKEGSTIGGLMDCLGTSVSMGLQYGVPLDVFVKKFSHTRFEPMGFTGNPDIPMAKSVMDYIFRWMGATFLGQPASAKQASATHANADHAPEFREFAEPSNVSSNQTRSPTLEAAEQLASFQSDAPACDVCGAITVRHGTCYLCHHCGTSFGCS